MVRKPNTFFCFSPPVMLATFVIEVGILAYALIRYKMSPIVRAVSALLFFLSIFQLAEFNVCGGTGQSAEAWSRVGFVAITALPPLGLHLIQLVAGRIHKPLTLATYATGLIWAGVFGLSTWAFSGHVCGGNYIIFQLRDNVAFFYGMYYYFWLLVAVGLSVQLAKRQRKKTQQALRALTLGYLVFLLPTAIVGGLKPEATAGIPSIMCGFAILFALILVLAVLPKTSKRK
jgi:hypothetical protein